MNNHLVVKEYHNNLPNNAFFKYPKLDEKKMVYVV